jgi:hypothetical protein
MNFAIFLGLIFVAYLLGASSMAVLILFFDPRTLLAEASEEDVLP